MRARRGYISGVSESNEVTETQRSADAILRTIRQLVRRISEHSRYLSREVGLTVPQLICLKAIGALEELDPHATVSVASVSKRVQLSAATVSRIIDRLARAGLVDRERSHRDRRKVHLTLTAAGLERYQTLPTPLQETFMRRLAELPDVERSELLSALQRIAVLMEATDIDASPILTPEADVKTEQGYESSADD